MIIIWNILASLHKDSHIHMLDQTLGPTKQHSKQTHNSTGSITLMAQYSILISSSTSFPHSPKPQSQHILMELQDFWGVHFGCYATYFLPPDQSLGWTHVWRQNTVEQGWWALFSAAWFRQKLTKLDVDARGSTEDERTEKKMEICLEGIRRLSSILLLLLLALFLFRLKENWSHAIRLKVPVE